MRAWVLVVAVLVSAPAAADDPAATGEELAKAGRFSEAIDAFKAADKQELRASHACLIALAYTRRELWPQAEIWLATCQKRATPSDPLPDWFETMTAQIAERLATANAAAVTIRVEPASAGAMLSVSSFPPDERFEPRTIHLPVGSHVITAHAPGYLDTQATVDVASKAEQHVVIHLREPPPPSKAVMYVGAGIAAAGVVAYGWMSYEWLAARQSGASWDDHIDMLHAAKYTTATLWATGAVTFALGYYLYRRDREHAPAVAAVPIDHGGLVTIGWRQ